MSNENPRLKEWLEKFENPNDSTPPSIVTRSHNQTARQVITLESIHYVGFWRRFFAFFLDNIILTVLGALIHNWAIAFLIAALYYIALTSSPLQGTIGKLAIGAMVVDMDGNKLRVDKSALRFLLFLLAGCLLLIGWIMVGFHGKKQGLHDMLARTLVINRR